MVEDHLVMNGSTSVYFRQPLKPNDLLPNGVTRSKLFSRGYGIFNKFSETQGKVMKLFQYWGIVWEGFVG